MNEIQTPDLALRLTRRYGVRERFPLATVASELQPVVIMDDLRDATPATRVAYCSAGTRRVADLTLQPHFFVRNGTFNTADVLNQTGVAIEMVDARLWVDAPSANKHVRVVVVALNVTNPASITVGQASYSDRSRVKAPLPFDVVEIPVGRVGSFPAAVPLSGRQDYAAIIGPVIPFLELPLKGWIVPPGAAVLVEVEDEVPNIEYSCSFRWTETPLQTQIA